MYLLLKHNLLKTMLRCMVMLLCCTVVAQPKLTRKTIDSLNRAAAEHPAEVLRAADRLIMQAKKQKKALEYGYLLQVKGVAETSVGNNTQALQYHMASYRILDSVKDNRGRIFSLCNIAAVHLNMENYGKADDYLKKALAITRPDDANSLKTIYANLGVCYQYNNKPRKAIEYFNKAVAYHKKLDDVNGMAVTLHNIAVSYIELDDFTNAEHYELLALEYQKKSGSINSLAMISLTLGGLYTDFGYPEKAGPYLEAGGKAAKELDSPYYKEIHAQSMVQWFEAKNDTKNENIWLKKLVDLRDSIYLQENIAATAGVEEKFQNDLKTKEIELLKAQKKLDEERIKRNRAGWIVFGLVTALCLIIIIILFRNYKLKQKANLLLGREKTALQEQNLQLEHENVLVQFETLKNQLSPHFLFNSLNALASLIKADPDKALEFTGVFSKIFRNALQLKDRHLITLAEELQHVDAYLYLQKMRFGANLKVSISASAEAKMQYLPPFSLQLVVENAIKHNVITTDKPLEIIIKAEKGLLRVENNLQQRRHVEDSTGTGIANIISRYHYFDAAPPVFETRGGRYIVELPLLPNA